MGVVLMMCCPAHTGNEVSCGVDGVLCAVWPCGFCVLSVGWVAGYWWP